MDRASRLLALAVVAFVFFGYVLWAIEDAHRRGKSAILVFVGVVFFFPLGLAAWLLFRPPLQDVPLPAAGRSLPVNRR
jgi:hypothetical protein